MAESKKPGFYVATGLNRAADAQRVAGVLKAAGWRQTYDWAAHGSVASEGLLRIREVAEAEICGVGEADVVVVLLPGGRGTHAELGAALALGKFVVLCASPVALNGREGFPCSFYHHPLVRLVATEAEILPAATEQLRITRMLEAS